MVLGAGGGKLLRGRHPGASVMTVTHTGPWNPPIVQEGTTGASSAPWQQPGSGYRYLTTGLLTGALTGDWLPIVGQSFTRALSSTGPGSAALISTGDPVTDAANLTAVARRKTVLWVMQAGAMVWNGIIWDWQHSSILDGTLPLGCATIDSLLSRRIINTTISVTGDVFDIARAIVGYALGKTPNGTIAGLTFSPGSSGITDSVTFDQSQRQTCMDALNTLTSVYGIEWSFRPYQDSAGNFLTSFDLGYPALGQPFPASGLDYQFPGNCLDYAFPVSGSAGASRVLATATASGTGGGNLFGRATDETDAANGFPLTETAVSASSANWATNDQVKAYAEGVLAGMTPDVLTPLLTLPGGVYPQVAQTALGSYAQFTATSWLHPAGPGGAPGFAGTGRVVSWTLSPPQPGQAETTQIQLGGLAPEGAAVHFVD
jgi:hypothetical protein